jgi:hypothetical protein
MTGNGKVSLVLFLRFGMESFLSFDQELPNFIVFSSKFLFFFFKSRTHINSTLKLH